MFIFVSVVIETKGPCLYTIAKHNRKTQKIMEENNKMTAQQSLKLISETINNSSKEIVARSGKYFILWGALLSCFSLIIYFLWKSTGNAAWNNLWFALPVVGYIIARLYNKKEDSIQAENYVSKMLGNIWSAFGVFSVSISLFTLLYGVWNTNPLSGMVVNISLTAIIILLFGLAETISGMAVKNWPISIAGFVTGIGGVIIYYMIGDNSVGMEQMFIFTFAGVVLALTGVIVKMQKR